MIAEMKDKEDSIDGYRDLIESILQLADKMIMQERKAQSCTFVSFYIWQTLAGDLGEISLLSRWQEMITRWIAEMEECISGQQTRGLEIDSFTCLQVDTRSRLEFNPDLV